VARRTEPMEGSSVVAELNQPTARIHRIGTGAAETRRPRAGPHRTEADLAIERWDDLFTSINATLRRTVSGPSSTTSGAQALHAIGRMRSGVLDCLAALGELHVSLLHELGRRRQLECEIDEIRSELAREHEELLVMQAVEKQARHLAQHDELTSLPNRSCFRDRLHRGLAPAASPPRSLALLFLDLDGFKQINDAHGHAIGDQLLKIVAARLMRAIRAGDMVSRVGGDEFACLPANPLDREQLTALASKLFRTVSAPLKIGRVQVEVRPSIGIAVFPADGADVDALLKNADAAMYRAKRLRTRFEFFSRDADA
jgi:diguanylate cyclase (GGDEF)-like protein